MDLIRRLLYVSLLKTMVRENSSYSLIRMNMDEAVVPESFGKRAIGIGGDMAKAITDIRGAGIMTQDERREYLIQYLLKEKYRLADRTFLRISRGRRICSAHL